jgi:hypothetical protein
VCICVLYYCHRVATQLRLTNISYHKDNGRALAKSRSCQACIDSHGPQLINLILLLYESINLCKRTDLIGPEYLSLVSIELHVTFLLVIAIFSNGLGASALRLNLLYRVQHRVVLYLHKAQQSI